MNKVDLVIFFYQECYNPIKNEWVQAIKHGHFATWPGLADNLVNKYLRKSEATTERYLFQEFKGVKSTHPTPITPQLIPVNTIIQDTPSTSSVRKGDRNGR